MADAPDPPEREIKRFDPRTLDRTIVALPLIEAIENDPDREGGLHEVIIDVHFAYPGGRDAARKWINIWLEERLRGVVGEKQESVHAAKSRYSTQYVFARLKGSTIRALAESATSAVHVIPTPDQERRKSPAPPIYKIWLDFDLKARTNVSLSTVKANAAHAAFGALGERIIWAVADSGVDAMHPHFETHHNLELDPPLMHRDFTRSGDLEDKELEDSALKDPYGHGTHVAGIVAGVAPSGDVVLEAIVRERVNLGDAQTKRIEAKGVSGVAPKCKLLSLKVLDDDGAGLSSNLIAAIEYIQFLNGNGREIRVHGLNVSVGYSFKPEWFACGESPLCVEINRLVQSGVSVVVAAGNDGYGFVDSKNKSGAPAGLDVTINDPGNAELAITVGSTHREMPHRYGVSYFSSKGPTGDGRLKPDLLAPGEKIISCASSQRPPERADVDVGPRKDGKKVASYREDSGTSMAAPHVSGAIAAFLSIRREFIGRPQDVKQVFLESATDLRRAVYFQGKGLVDLMRAIQSV